MKKITNLTKNNKIHKEGFDAGYKKARKQLERDIKGMKKVYVITNETDEYTFDTRNVYNHALQDVLDLLKKETKKEVKNEF